MRDVSKTSNTARLSLLLGSLLTVISGCEIQNDKVEDDIKAKLKEKGVEITSIKCPKGIKLKEGSSFECEGESDRGDTFTVGVKQTDGKGSINWELEGRIVDPKEIVDNVKKKGGPPDFSCGKSDKFIAVKGTKVKCKGGGEELTFKFKNDEGDYEAETSP
jgi:hypothetical protein